MLTRQDKDKTRIQDKTRQQDKTRYDKTRQDQSYMTPVGSLSLTFKIMSIMLTRQDKDKTGRTRQDKDSKYLKI